MHTPASRIRVLALAAACCLPWAAVGASRQQDPPAYPGPSFDDPARRPQPAKEEQPEPSNRFDMLIESGGPDLSATLNLSRATFAQEGADFDPCVSRDGSLLAFASTQHSPTADLYIKKTDSRLVTRLTSDPGDDLMPRISPDGAQIAFASNRAGNWDIYVMPSAGGKAMQVTSDPTDEIAPSWSPDGSRLVFSRKGEMSGRWEMWAADARRPAVSSFIGYGLFPQWCPVAGTGAGGADQILFQLGRDRGRRTYGLWLMDLADGIAGNPTEVASSADRALINPSWSPDGRWIAYAEADTLQPHQPGGIARLKGQWSLWMISAQGEGRIRLTGDETMALSPTWAANDRLYFVSRRDGLENIWSLDTRRAVATASALVREPSQAASDPEATHNSDSLTEAPEGE